MVLAAQPLFREITDSDIDAVGNLLARGFPERTRAYWRQGLERQRTRTIPAGAPRYGYMLESDSAPVGCLLLIHATRFRDGVQQTFCNLSSWYVEPAFRNYGPLLASRAQKQKDVTYINATPAPLTLPIIEAQGFKRYVSGCYFSAPTLSRSGRGMTIETVTAETTDIDGLPDFECEMLVRHAGYDCVSLVCRTADGPLPFVFIKLRKRRGVLPLPTLQLGYCRSVADYVRCSAAIGRFLLWRGKPFVAIDANGPISGLAGFYVDGASHRYFKGPCEPQQGDLADTELVLYGM